MASAKPTIHGRDHLPGGADEIPNLATTDQLFVPDPDYGYYEVSDTSVAIDSGALGTWDHHSDATLLDLTTADTPAFTTKGVYAVTGTASFDGPWTAGTFPFGNLIFAPDLVSWTTIFSFQSQPLTNGGYSDFPPPVSFAATFQANAGATLQLQFWNFDEATAHTMSATQIRVQRIFSFT